jgi:hypothetical protein
MGPEIFWIDPAQHTDPITLDIYPLASGQSSFTLYDDDGASMQYQQGRYAQTEVTVNANVNKLAITVGAAKGEYQGKPDMHNYVLKINLLNNKKINQTLLNGTKINQLLKQPNENQVYQQTPGWWIDQQNNLLFVYFNTKSSAENTIVVK